MRNFRLELSLSSIKDILESKDANKALRNRVELKLAEYKYQARQVNKVLKSLT